MEPLPRSHERREKKPGHSTHLSEFQPWGLCSAPSKALVDSTVWREVRTLLVKGPASVPELAV